MSYQRGMSDNIVSLAMDGTTAVITMDDGKANAISPALVAEIGAALDEAADAKVIVLTGREGKFRAGFDLRIMMAGPQAMRDLVLLGGELLVRLYEIPQPLVIACTGHALAGGVLLVATGDTRIGVTGPFKLGLNEVRNGMPVPILAHEFARERLDPRELVAATVQARTYDPEAAVRAGWLDRVVAPEMLMDEAMTEAAELSKISGSAYAATKRSLRRKTIEYIRSTVDSNLNELTGLS